MLNRSSRSFLLSAAAIAALGMLVAGHAVVSASTLYWDPGTSGTGATYGGGTWDTGNWSNGATDQTYVSGSDAVFGGTQSGTATVTLAAAQTASSITFNTSGYTLSGSALTVSNLVSVNGASDTIANQLTGAAGVTVTGAGTLTISNASDNYSGALSVLSGTLKDTAHDGSAGTELGSGTITLGSNSNNATLNLDLTGGNPVSYSNAISVNGTGTNTIEVTSYNPTFTGAVTLNTSNLTLISDNSGGSTLSLNGGITGTGNVILQVNDNRSSSSVSIGTGGINNVGTITNNSTGTAGQLLKISGVIGSNVTTVTQDSAQTSLVLSKSGDSYGTLSILSGILTDQDNGSTGTALGSGTVTLGSSTNNATLNLDLNSLVTYGTANAISVYGTGTNTIETTSYYSTLNGAITLNDSNLSLITNNSGGSTMAVNGGITGMGNITLEVNDNKSSSNLSIGAGGIDNVGTITNNGTGSAGQTVTISGVIGSNVTNLTQDSADTTLVLSNSGDNYGSLSILSGTLKDTAYDPTNTNGTELGSGTITIGSGANNATLNLDLTEGYPVYFGNAISVNGTGTNTIEVTNWLVDFNGAVTLNNSNLSLIVSNNNRSYMNFNGGITGTGNVTLQVNDTNNGSQVNIGTGGINNVGTITNNGTGTVGQTLTISGAIGANVTGVTQDSVDTKLLLSGTNLYTGPTTVAAGTLTIDGSQATSNITIDSGGTLNGDGTLIFNINGNNADLISDLGTLNISSLKLALNLTGTQTLSQYVLADYNGGTLLGSTFASVTGLQPGWSINYDDSNEIVLSQSAVPAPATLGLVAIGALGLLLLKRRRA